VQRVHAARVEVDGQVVGEIGRGLCAFIGVAEGDQDADVRYLANKIASLRVFCDESGKMTRSVTDVEASVLVVSQFTLVGDVRRGHRPSFTAAMAPDSASVRVDELIELVRERGLTVQTGQFGANMRVVVDNDGPVTILIDSHKTF